jgi:hypothetical protein
MLPAAACAKGTITHQAGFCIAEVVCPDTIEGTALA